MSHRKTHARKPVTPPLARGKALPHIARAKRPRVGTTFRFALNESARVRLTFKQQLPGRRIGGRCGAPTKGNRHHRAFKRTATRGALSFALGGGAHRMSFQGRISKHKRLKPGRYTLIISATNPAGRSASKKLTFVIAN